MRFVAPKPKFLLLTCEFFCQAPGGQTINLGKALTGDLSSEKVGGFTGVYPGMFASGNRRKNTNPADFDYAQYDTETN